MSIFKEAQRTHYWRTNSAQGPLHLIIRDAMSRNRWEAINSALHISDPNTATRNDFDKIVSD